MTRTVLPGCPRWVVRCVAASWVGLALTVAACSSDTSHPAALGGCKGSADAGCGVNGSSGGGASGRGQGEGGTGTGDGAVAGEDGGACGSAGSLLNASNNQCLPCVTASCCQAEEACTGQCLDLVQCTAGINNCAMQFSGGLTAYNDFATCLSRSCPTQCPALPLTTNGDF